MDIQGAEVEATRGMKALLQAHPDLILTTELWPQGLSNAGHSVETYLTLLEDMGFDHYYEIGKTIASTSPEALLARYAGGQTGHTNLICARRPLST